jgi:hypothetical protein
VFAAVKIQATAKSMIDHSSLGTEYLGIGFRGDQLQGSEDEIVLATREFAALRAKLGSWSWAINTSSILPPVRNQFRAMEKMADLGPRMVASRQFDQSGSRLGSSGSPTNICRSAEELRSVSGNLIDQLEENRQDMLKHVTLTSRGLC